MTLIVIILLSFQILDTLQCQAHEEILQMA